MVIENLTLPSLQKGGTDWWVLPRGPSAELMLWVQSPILSHCYWDLLSGWNSWWLGKCTACTQTSGIFQNPRADRSYLSSLYVSLPSVAQEQCSESQSPQWIQPFPLGHCSPQSGSLMGLEIVSSTNSLIQTYSIIYRVMDGLEYLEVSLKHDSLLRNSLPP